MSPVTDWSRSETTARCFAAAFTGAPIDGVVHKLAAVGDEASPGVSPALYEFERRRSHVADVPCEYGLQSFDRANGSLLFKVHSDVLQLQLVEERRKLCLARLKLSQLEKQRDMEIGVDKEPGLSQKEIARLRLRVESDWEYFGNFTGGPRIAAGWGNEPRAGVLFSKLAKVPMMELEIAAERQAFLVDDWKVRIDTASAEVESAESSVEITELQTKFGEVYCSQKCRVTEVRVLSFQYVTQGDPVLDVAVIS